ncbi:hypothetical protein HYW42_01160 [Candidatus Daviesbacteria bacterium]|nr:hypothetical protein [Candidatus Daviesbacteria bacterium]
MSFIKNNLGLIFFAIAILTVIIVASVYLILKPSSQPTPSPVVIFSPSPKPNLEQKVFAGEPDPNRSYQVITEQNKQQGEQDYLVGVLADKLPFQGVNFSLLYNISNNQFVVVFNSSNKSVAEQEFNRFLEQNGIKDQGWLYNLYITEQPYE